MYALSSRASVGAWAAGVAVLLAGGAAPGRAADPPQEKSWRLEFRILATKQDDADAFDAATKALTDPKRKDELQKLAEEGKPPPGVAVEKGPGYSWVELAPAELRALKLDDESQDFTKQAAKARDAGEPVVTPDPIDDDRQGNLLFSRPCRNAKLSKEERDAKKVDYFLLTRLPEKDKALTGEFLTGVKTREEKGRLFVEFTMNEKGSAVLKDVTSRNVGRTMAVVVDGRIVSAPKLQSAISSGGQISGDFTQKEIDALADSLRSDMPKKDK